MFWCLIYTFDLNAKNDTFKPVNIDILFYVKFANFWYITCFVSNLYQFGRNPMVYTPDTEMDYTAQTLLRGYK